jgi:hypothetical protein
MPRAKAGLVPADPGHEAKLACVEHRREPYWTQALAVGNEAWLRDTAKKAGMRRCPLRQSESGELNYLYDRKCPVKNEP